VSAALLRRAAVKLREHAEAASPGPWLTTAAQPGYVFSDPADNTWLVAFTPVGKPSIPDAELIAMMHPRVALALAELLERAVAMISIVEGRGEHVDYKDAQPLLKVAREILREPQS
jgi:hypothetical protein